ncbi:MAG: bifunctional hydroxymethylpyrimidine kinase/phosphomethylpyrimidine kinase [bacterium]|nr:bifunctional hydroxymethylpyrimidine kinase/phosphomethylpyrimidine kinase [bacterium]
MKPYKGIALTIAGSDSGGGAGIQADLKTFEAFDVYGMSVITALTAQNTYSVTGIYPVTPDFVKLQIETVFEDIPPGAVKTGMLFTREIIEVVAGCMIKFNVDKLVVDPVMVAKSGAKLLRDDAIDALINTLLPAAFVVTPNIPEAEIMAEMEISTEEDMIKAGEKILEKGTQWVLIKGGHLESKEVIDILIGKDGFWKFKGEKIVTTSTHGTGCTLSSAIAALLSMNYSVQDAVCIAKKYIQRAIKNAPPIGHGHGPLRHKVEIEFEATCF